jgi:hypothetical protein
VGSDSTLMASSSILLRTFVLQVSASAAAMVARGGDTMVQPQPQASQHIRLVSNLPLVPSSAILAAAPQGLAKLMPWDVKTQILFVTSHGRSLHTACPGSSSGASFTDWRADHWLVDLFTQDADTRMY